MAGIETPSYNPLSLEGGLDSALPACESHVGQCLPGKQELRRPRKQASFLESYKSDPNQCEEGSAALELLQQRKATTALENPPLNAILENPSTLHILQSPSCCRFPARSLRAVLLILSMWAISKPQDRHLPQECWNLSPKWVPIIRGACSGLVTSYSLRQLHTLLCLLRGPWGSDGPSSGVMVCAPPSGGWDTKDKGKAGQPAHTAKAMGCTSLAFSLFSNQGEELVTISKTEERGAVSVVPPSVFHRSSDL